MKTNPNNLSTGNIPGYALAMLVLLFLLPLRSMSQTTIKTFAVMADYGCAGSNEESVATLVKSWQPEFIISPGDASYAKDPTSIELGCPDNSIDDNVGRYFADYLYPYNGSYPRSATAPAVNRFYPVPGNHDYQSPISAWEAYFSHTDPTSNSSHSKRYYDFQIDIGNGDKIHFFGLNTNERSKRTGCDPAGDQTLEPCNGAKYDSIEVGHTQYEWLKTQIASSTAKFKIVFMHMSPYSSLPPGDADKGTKNKLKEWKFNEWGADIVLAGDDHYYERNWRNDMPYVVNGVGGHPLFKKVKKKDIVTGNLVHYDSNYGAVKVDVIQLASGKKDLHFQFINIAGMVIDDFYLLPQKAVEFNFDGGSYLTDAVQGITATGNSSITRTTGHDGVSNSAVQFDDNGHISLPAQLGNYMNPSGDGYTVSCWVRANNTPADKRQVFWGKDANHVLTGFKQENQHIALDRYIDWVYPNAYWEMDSWKPDLFFSGGGWHKIVVSVKEDMLRVKVYQPGEISSQWGNMGYGGHTELTYMGGQAVDKVTQFGFGAVTGVKAVRALDDFRIYNYALDFRAMDEMYLEEIGTPGGSGLRQATEQEVGIISASEQPLISVYPNPADDHLVIRYSGNETQGLEVSISTMLGVTFFYEPMSSEEITINTGMWPAGFYLVKVTGKEIRTVKKIIVR